MTPGYVDYELEILLTLALVTAGVALALRLEVAGPLAVAVAGSRDCRRGACTVS